MPHYCSVGRFSYGAHVPDGELHQLRSQVAQLTKQLAEKESEIGRLSASLERYTHCWHCKVELMEDDPHYCESCPEWHGCDYAYCEAPGCAEETSDLRAERDAKRQ
jgi:hypothetical protein